MPAIDGENCQSRGRGFNSRRARHFQHADTKRGALPRLRILAGLSEFCPNPYVPGQKRKQPYLIRLKGGAPFAFAGLWTPPHLAPPTCVIITTDANELLAPIHNRMPVILDPDDEALWLDPGCVAPVKVLPCLRPFPSERMETILVSALVSSPSNDGPELIEPVSA